MTRKITIKDIIPGLDAKILCGGEFVDREISGGFACDMLSWVMSRLQAGQAWFTVLNSVNVLAVAVLAECSCVIMTENVEMESDVLSRAIEKKIVVLTTPLPTYEACVVLSKTLEMKNSTL